MSRRIQLSAEIPNDYVPFVQRMVAARRFLSEADVLAEGLRLLQAREALGDEVRKGFEELDAGVGISGTQVFAEAEQRVRNARAGES